MKKLLAIVLLQMFSNGAWTLELDTLLDKIDRVYRSESSTSVLEMRIETPNWIRTLEMKVWTKGLEKTFITILSPRKEMGISTLKNKNKMWNYFPKINKVIKVPPSMMMGAWMGSDFTNDDLVKENTYRHDYHYKLLEKSEKIYTIELLPKENTVSVWGRLILMIDIEKLVPVKQEFYDEKDVKVREMTFSKVENIEGNYFPKKIILVPLGKPGNKTIIEYKNLKLNANVSDRIFTIKNLQKRR